MNKIGLTCIFVAIFIATACSPIKPDITNHYKLESYSGQVFTHQHSHHSILVTKPEAMAGYQTDQMLYIQKPYELSSFAHSGWVSPPADMLYPLMIESLQRTGYFYAVASGAYADKANYRLDTQLIELQQNFLTKPSCLQLVAKVVLTRIEDNHILGSRLIRQSIPCPSDTPYGGVLAANRATQNFTAQVAKFAVKLISQQPT